MHWLSWVLLVFYLLLSLFMEHGHIPFEKQQQTNSPVKCSSLEKLENLSGSW